MLLKFTKMHGLGNDFVVLDGVRQNVDLSPELVRRLADRHFGVGCDQVLLVEKAVGAEADFRYRIFNADGGEVFQCGNGARCFARFVLEQKLCDKSEIIVETGAGSLRLKQEADGTVTVNMGVPRHAPAEIPLESTHEAPVYSVAVEGGNWDFGAVSMGNPHATIMVDDVDTAPVLSLGPVLESHPLFPERANIGFLQPTSRHHGRLRVFERGAGETLACGSGACAAVVIGVERALFDSPVRIELPGGSLMISWEGRGMPVFMSGPAVSVYEGTIRL